MSRFNFQYISWLMSQMVKMLSIWGLLGVLTCLASALFYITQTLSLAQETTALQQSVDEASRNIKRAEVKTFELVAAKKDPNQEIGEFYAMFPQGKYLADSLRQIHQTALKHQITLNQGDYKLAANKQLQMKQEQVLSRYEFVLPITGKYIQIRQFVSAILAQQPALALNDIQIKRENNLSPSVEARLVLVLFFKGDAS